MPDYATGGPIKPGSWIAVDETSCTLHVPPTTATQQVSVTFSDASALEQVFADWLTKAIRTGKINPDDSGSAGVLAMV